MSAESSAQRRARDGAQRTVAALGVISSLLNRIAAGVAAALLVLMTLHILLEICLRFFGYSTYMAEAVVSYGVAAITFLALAWALEHGSMIRVSVLVGRLPVQGRRLADGFATLSTLAIVAFLIPYQWASVTRVFARGSTSPNMVPIPLWIPEAIFLVGLLLLALQLVARAGRLATGQARHDSDNAVNI